MQIQITNFHFLHQLWIFMNENFLLIFFSWQNYSHKWLIIFNEHQFRPLLINFYLTKKNRLIASSDSCIVFRPSTYLKKNAALTILLKLYNTRSCTYIRSAEHKRNATHKKTLPFDQMFNFFFILFFNHLKINCFELKRKKNARFIRSPTTWEQNAKR